MRILLIALAIACLSACSFIGFPGVYRINVEQGNIVTQEMVELKPGLSRRQVRFILGTPLIEDPFNPDRWDYRYTKRNGLKVLSDSRLTVRFEGDSLVAVEGDFTPANWPGQDSSSDNDPTGEQDNPPRQDAPVEN